MVLIGSTGIALFVILILLINLQRQGTIQWFRVCTLYIRFHIQPVVHGVYTLCTSSSTFTQWLGDAVCISNSTPAQCFRMRILRDIDFYTQPVNFQPVVQSTFASEVHTHPMVQSTYTSHLKFTPIQWFRVRILHIWSSHPPSGSEYVYFISEVHTHPVVQSMSTLSRSTLIQWFRARIPCIRHVPHSSSGSKHVYFVYQVPQQPVVQSRCILYIRFHTQPVVYSTSIH